MVCFSYPFLTARILVVTLARSEVICVALARSRQSFRCQKEKAVRHYAPKAPLPAGSHDSLAGFITYCVYKYISK